MGSMWMTRAEVDGKLEDIHELNKPAYKAVHHAEILYGSDDHHCELGLNLNERQQVFLRMGRAEVIIEELTTDWLLLTIGDIVHEGVHEDDSQDRRLQDPLVEVEQVKVPSIMASHIAELEDLLF